MADEISADQAQVLGSLAMEKLTNIPASTWRYWAVNKMGPRSFKLGRRRVWRKSEVLDWIAAQEAATGVGGAALLPIASDQIEDSRCNSVEPKGHRTHGAVPMTSGLPDSRALGPRSDRQEEDGHD